MAFSNKEIIEEIAISTRHDVIYEKPQAQIFRKRNTKTKHSIPIDCCKIDISPHIQHALYLEHKLRLTLPLGNR